eukprot:CAMPEP_0169168820 /NCGR_PEP_ID=MMETSP1015-20121227/61192_1 /TAXON_ID=342587 /ORGANISM="Karlodinium micrum, Strain CCMP2283" /LENGTH=631 /DNA_ID=CAMNT_0009241589 /DNA_START=149 /DNA_END=2044 /DNA_ORIENTATION=+
MSYFAFALIVLPPVVAQVSFHERQSVVSKHITLNSRGDASYERRGDIDSEPQSSVDEEGDEYIQVVNGSTPTGWVHLGSPPKKMLAIFDTGSDKFVAKTWETLEAEMLSFDPSSEGMVMPTMWVYDHNTSSTYEHKLIWKNTTREWVPEREMISYGSGVAETLDGFDTLHVGGHSIDNMTLSEITADSLQLLHTRAGISAVMGLQHMKNKSLGSSVFSVARNRSMLTSFGYCVDPRGRESSQEGDDELSGDNGTFIWGDKSTEGTKLDVVGDMHWAVKLGTMQVMGGKQRNSTGPEDENSTADAIKQKFKDASFGRGGESKLRQAGEEPYRTRGTFGRDDATPYHEEVREDEEVITEAEAACANNSCCGILDSGSNIIAGPTHLMKAIADQLDVDPFCKNYEDLPKIQLVFGGMTVNVSKEGYVMKVPVPKWAGNGEDAGGDVATLDNDVDPSESEASMPTKRWSLSEVSSRITSKRNWKAVFERLHRERGIDFRPILSNFLESENQTDGDAPALMCMPALVPLDMRTKFGPLFVVGTPLLATHYARWSFPKDATNPSIYLKKLEDCDRCRHAHESAQPKFLQAGAARSFIRSESQGTVSATQPDERRSGPVIRHIDDIRFPHWARRITDI